MSGPRTRRVLLLSMVAALGAGAVPAPPASASASWTELCTGYTGCTKAGMGTAGYAPARRTMWWRMYAGHNCTNYAAYRMVHSGLPNVRPWKGSGNAMNWGVAERRLTDARPAVGAVAWWRPHTGPAGAVGHVAYVERVAPGRIVVSQDSWHGDFSWARVTEDSDNWPSGFVHLNDVPLRDSVLPRVTGTAKVGHHLTASAGAWTPTPTAFRYGWRANGHRLAHATGRTLVVRPAQRGQRISVDVIASRTGYPTTRAVSLRTHAVTGRGHKHH
jgi:surface antigen